MSRIDYLVPVDIVYYSTRKSYLIGWHLYNFNTIYW